jgi:hypothetical protein
VPAKTITRSLLMRAKLTTTALALTLIVPGLALAQQSTTTTPPPAVTAPGAAGVTGDPATGAAGTMGATGTRTQDATTAAGDTGTATGTSPATTPGMGTGTTAPTTTAEGMPDNPIYGMKGEQIVGQTLYGSNGEEIGEIDNVVLNEQTKQAAAVVGVGGFLGIGERDVAIPLDQLQVGADNKLTTSMTKEALSAMQPYEEGGWSKLDPMGTARDWMNR